MHDDDATSIKQLKALLFLTKTFCNEFWTSIWHLHWLLSLFHCVFWEFPQSQQIQIQQIIKSLQLPCHEWQGCLTFHNNSAQNSMKQQRHTHVASLQTDWRSSETNHRSAGWHTVSYDRKSGTRVSSDKPSLSPRERFPSVNIVDTKTAPVSDITHEATTSCQLSSCRCRHRIYTQWKENIQKVKVSSLW